MDLSDPLRMRMDAQDRVLAAIRDDARNSKQQLDRVEAQVRETNGRVKKLELWQASVLGAAQAMSWRGPVVIGVLSAVGGAVAAKLLGA